MYELILIWKDCFSTKIFKPFLVISIATTNKISFLDLLNWMPISKWIACIHREWWKQWKHVKKKCFWLGFIQLFKITSAFHAPGFGRIIMADDFRDSCLFPQWYQTKYFSWPLAPFLYRPFKLQYEQLLSHHPVKLTCAQCAPLMSLSTSFVLK